MQHSDLMQFKDEMLKNLREMERKIMSKVNKTQTDISSDLNSITASINSLKENNNNILDSITEQQLTIVKISTIESDLKKFNTTLSGQEKKINDSMIEISYIRERCEKSLSDSLFVPGIIGKNCKFSNFNDYIINNNKEISRLKNEKEYNKKESKELKQKLEQGIKSLSNLVDTFINRSKLYTDGTKNAIINLIDTKISELDMKNLELLAKLCKIENELGQKIEKLGNDLNEFNTNKNEQIQKIEDKLIIVNNHFEEIDKNIKETKEELNNVKKNEEKYINEFSAFKNNLNSIINPENNNENNELNNNTVNNINDSKEINSIINNVMNSSNINYNLSQSNINNKIKTTENSDNSNIINSKENKNISLKDNNPINQKESVLLLNRSRNKGSNTDRPLIKFNNNNINNAITTFNNINKNVKFSNPSNNKKITKENIIEEKDAELNNPINIYKKQIFNIEKEQNIIKDEIALFLNKKIPSNNSKQKINKFPIIKEKFFKDIFIAKKNSIINKKNNTLFNHKNKSPKRAINIKIKNKNNLKYSIDKETGVGCNVVKLSIEDDSVTPYNTNGLLTMASNKFLKKRLIKSDESLSFSFDNIFSNIYQYQINRNYIRKKKPKGNKTTRALFGEDKFIFDTGVNSYDNNIKKEFFKTIKI